MHLMKTTRTIVPLVVVFAITAGFASVGSAQKPVEVKIKKLEVIEQTSPEYAVDLVKKKRISRNKKWLEVEVEFEANKVARAGDPNPFIDGLLVKYFVVFKGKDPVTGKNIMATGQLNHINIEPGETTHSSMYISPSSAAKIRGKAGDASSTEIEGFAVQFIYQGQIAEEDANYSPGTKWWTTGVLPPKDGILMPRSKTPFAPLWYDYFAEEEQSR